MCRDCGCGEHHHDHDHHHPDEHQTRTIIVRRRILEHNDRLAAQLRETFDRSGVLAVNVVSSPGSGKTELLARTLAGMGDEWSMAALTGDLATENDAARLAATGAPTKQILTGTLCHLESDMVAEAITDWDLAALDVLFVENVGNLVCPSDFDLGEHLRVMLVATTEGEDKPLKYPTLTRSSDVAVISKIDLADAVDCDVDRLEHHLREMRPGIEVVRVSARTGEGLETWFGLLRAHHQAAAIRAG